MIYLIWFYVYFYVQKIYYNTISNNNKEILNFKLFDELAGKYCIYKEENEITVDNLLRRCDQ